CGGHSNRAGRLLEAPRGGKRGQRLLPEGGGGIPQDRGSSPPRGAPEPGGHIMSQAIYRRKGILARIRKALDAFYLLQKIDWEYDIRATLEKILGLALEEIEFEGGKQIERGLIIIEAPGRGELEIQAGWKADEPDLTFSRTVVQQT